MTGKEWSAVYYEQATLEQLQTIHDSLDYMSSQTLDIIIEWMKGGFTLSFSIEWNGK